MTSDRARWHVDLATTVVIILTCVGLLWANRDGIWPPPPPPGLALPEQPLSLEDAVVDGSPAARVVIVMYTDYQCPYCARFEQTTLEQIRKMYIEPGRVRLAVRHYPLEAIHPRAFAAAAAATCAGRQGHFWALHKALFTAQQKLDPAQIETLAREADMDASAFMKCTSSEEVARLVRADVANAKSLGLTGTPAFLIGTADASGNVKVASIITGSRPLSEFSHALDSLLEPRTFRTWWIASATIPSLFCGVIVVWRRRRAQRFEQSGN